MRNSSKTAQYSTHTEAPPKITCWICNRSEANTREHMIKKSDAIRIFSQDGNSARFSSENYSVSRYDFASIEEAEINPPTAQTVQGANSNSIKYGKSLCDKCNNTLTQPYDMAWSSFFEALIANDSNQASKLLKQRPPLIELYFAKQIGCLFHEASIGDQLVASFKGPSFSNFKKLSWQFRNQIIAPLSNGITTSKSIDGFQLFITKSKNTKEMLKIEQASFAGLAGLQGYNMSYKNSTLRGAFVYEYLFMEFSAIAVLPVHKKDFDLALQLKNEYNR